jgi:hypothetical protein
MSRRARYDGPHEEVHVFDPEASVEAPPLDRVKRGGLLSADVPARIRDELLSTEWWSEVNQADHSKAADKSDAKSKEG